MTRGPPRRNGEDEFADDAELGILRDVFRMLPAGVTVQDEHGRFLLVNDAAAAQLGMAAGAVRRASLETTGATAARPALNCSAPGAPPSRRNA